LHTLPEEQAAMKCSVKGREFEITLHDTPTARAVRKALPIETTVNRWGDEIYCLTDVAARKEPEAREQMTVGEVAYWPPQQAIAMFFGPTPVSTDEHPRAYSPCNVFGTFEADAAFLRTVEDGEPIRFLE
jgi:hypothetical protein